MTIKIIVATLASIVCLTTIGCNKSTSEKAEAITKTPHTKQVVTNSIGITMIEIQSGSFKMGGTENADQQPTHSVQIGEPFFLSRTEITQEQWKSVMGTQPWVDAPKDNCMKGANYPALEISWEGAREFCRRLGEKDGKVYRLPSESEWEYAARAGSAYLNEGDLDIYAWYRKNAYLTNEPYPHLVGNKKENAFGLYDMLGNVPEWCEDAYHPNYLGAPTDGSAWRGNDPQAEHVLRGGSFCSFSSQASYANRDWRKPTGTFICGFRIACNPVSK